MLRKRTYFNFFKTETIGKIDAVSSTVSNYAEGDQVGASWTDKVMMVKAQSADSEPSGGGVEQGEGADDEEWVKNIPQIYPKNSTGNCR